MIVIVYHALVGLVSNTIVLYCFISLLCFFIVMRTTKKSRAEIQRAYRERLLAKNAELMREKERKRWRNRCSLNKIKNIGNMTEREK